MGEFHGNQHTETEYEGYTHEELVASLQMLAEEMGQPPTTRDAQADDRFPCLERMYSVIDSSWSEVLREAGVTPDGMQVGEYGEAERDAMVVDVQSVHERVSTDHLTMRQYDEYGEYASSSVKKHFGSWREACEASGISPGERHGTSTMGPGGARLDSRHELAVAMYLHQNGIEYEVHPPLGENNWYGDFYLADRDLWVEVNGYASGERPNAEQFERKLALYDRTDKECVVVRSVEELEQTLGGRGDALTRQVQ
jgi:hypothetical protein